MDYVGLPNVRYSEPVCSKKPDVTFRSGARYQANDIDLVPNHITCMRLLDSFFIRIGSQLNLCTLFERVTIIKQDDLSAFLAI